MGVMNDKYKAIGDMDVTNRHLRKSSKNLMKK